MSSVGALEAFLPHTNIPPKAIIELIVVQSPPNVPASHPRAKDSSFTGEYIRPNVERVENYLIIEPADERLARKIDMTRDLQEILDDLSKFNQEPPFPSFPDPFCIAELLKSADELFPGYNCLPSPHDAENLLDAVALEPLAVGDAGNEAQDAAQEDLDAFDLDPFDVVNSTAPTASGPQWHAAPTPIIGWPTPLPDYESPFSIPEELEDDNEASGTAIHTQPPFSKTPRQAEDAPLPSIHATQAQPHNQPATAVNSSACAIPAPKTVIPTAQLTFQTFNSSAGPSTLPVAVSSSAQAQASAQTFTFRASFAAPIMYSGPPQKSARKAPRKTTGKSTGKAAGKSARK